MKVPEDLAERVREIAKALNKTPEEVLRQALEMGLGGGGYR